LPQKIFHIANMSKIIRDSVLDSSVVRRNFKLPVDNKSKLSPHNKGNLLYNITDNVLYYDDETAWIPLIGGTGNNLIAGPGISITSNGNNITITNTSPATSVTLSSLGGAFPLVPFPETGPALGIMGLNSGTGITLTTDAATEVTVNNSTTLAGTGAGVSLVDVGVPPAYTLKDLIAGSNVTLSPVTATSVTINASGLLQKITQTFGPQGAGNFTIPVAALNPYMYAWGGGSGGAGGNFVQGAGQGGFGAAVIITPLSPGDVVSWSVIGAGSTGTTGQAVPTPVGNGGDTVLQVNNSTPLRLRGGIGPGNVLIDSGIYRQGQSPPASPVIFSGEPYPWGMNGGIGGFGGGSAGIAGMNGSDIQLRSTFGLGAPAVGFIGTPPFVSIGGGGGGGGSSLGNGGNGGHGSYEDASSILFPAGNGSPGGSGAGGGGGGGGNNAVNFPGTGGNGGDGGVKITYIL
jgi:hypothetical protein